MLFDFLKSGGFSSFLCLCASVVQVSVPSVMASRFKLTGA